MNLLTVSGVTAILMALAAASLVGGRLFERDGASAAPARITSSSMMLGVATDTPTPTHTPTPANTPPPPPSNTPPPSPTGIHNDFDGDGCRDWQEQGGDPTRGGLRNWQYEYDFYDPNGSQKIDATDIALVRAHFNPMGPLPPGDEIYDRSNGAAAWAPGGPDGVINALDIALVRASFNHDCRFYL